MPAVDILTGVAQVSLSQDDPTVIPSLSGVPVNYTPFTPDKLILRSGHTPLLTTDVYKATFAGVGRDSLRKGYTIANSMALSATIPIASNGDAIFVEIDTADFPGGLDKAVAIAMFLQVNAADPQLVGFAQIDGAANFTAVISSKPSKKAPRYPIASLTGGIASKIFGSRQALGVTYLPFVPTTGGVRFVHKTSKVTIRPDDAPDFDVVTTRATDIQFSILTGDNEFIVDAVGGNYVRYITGGVTYEFAETDLQSAIAQLEGNRSILVDMPESSAGISTRRLYLGNVQTNFQDVTENTSKTEQYQIDFNLQAAALDYMTKNLHGTTWQSIH